MFLAQGMAGRDPHAAPAAYRAPTQRLHDPRRCMNSLRMVTERKKKGPHLLHGCPFFCGTEQEAPPAEAGGPLTQMRGTPLCRDQVAPRGRAPSQGVRVCVRVCERRRRERTSEDGEGRGADAARGTRTTRSAVYNSKRGRRAHSPCLALLCSSSSPSLALSVFFFFAWSLSTRAAQPHAPKNAATMFSSLRPKKPGYFGGDIYGTCKQATQKHLPGPDAELFAEVRRAAGASEGRTAAGHGNLRARSPRKPALRAARARSGALAHPAPALTSLDWVVRVFTAACGGAAFRNGRGRPRKGRTRGKGGGAAPLCPAAHSHALAPPLSFLSHA